MSERLPQHYARSEYGAVLERVPNILVALDFDGTLAHIVEDPEAAHIHPAAPAALLKLARHVAGVAIITGRPVEQVLALGELEPLGAQLAYEGHNFFVVGQYGHEYWSAAQPHVVAPRPPQALSDFARALRDLLRASPWDPWLEEKGLAIAVHTRRLDDPTAAMEELLPDVTKLAEKFGLAIEPGRNVIEARVPGADKGQALRSLVKRLQPNAVVFAGDDLGDIAAFDILDTLRMDGMPTLGVCSASPEQTALIERADVVVAGPDGVVEFLTGLNAAIDARQ